MPEHSPLDFFNDDKGIKKKSAAIEKDIGQIGITGKQVNDNLEELNTHIENIERTIVGLETTKMYFINQKNQLENQIQLLNEFSEKETVEPSLVFKIEQVQFNGADLLTINMPFKLPMYKKVVGKKYDYYRELNHTYTKPLTEALTSFIEQNGIIKLNEVFVLISHYAPNGMIFDTDNRFHSFIFNSLRASKVITDDNHYRLSYMENGYAHSDSFKVLVTVASKENYVSAVAYSTQIQ